MDANKIKKIHENTQIDSNWCWYIDRIEIWITLIPLFRMTKPGLCTFFELKMNFMLPSPPDPSKNILDFTWFYLLHIYIYTYIDIFPLRYVPKTKKKNRKGNLRNKTAQKTATHPSPAFPLAFRFSFRCQPNQPTRENRKQRHLSSGWRPPQLEATNCRTLNLKRPNLMTWAPRRVERHGRLSVTHGKGGGLGGDCGGLPGFPGGGCFGRKVDTKVSWLEAS